MKKQIGNGFTPDGVEQLRLELKSLQSKNLKEAGFEELLNLVAS